MTITHANPLDPLVARQAEEIARLRKTIAQADLKALVNKVHGAKGRHHNQNAMCDLYDACGLSNVRPGAEVAQSVRSATVNPKLIAVLRGGRKCDEDGSEIIMSRQACCEAADILEAIAQSVQPCRGCNGHGEVGGLRSDGYHSEICPYCKGDGKEQIAQQVQPAPRSFAEMYKDNAQGIEIKRLKMRIEELEAAQPVQPSLSLYELDSLAQQFASSYTSPHHITFTVDSLRNFIQKVAIALPVQPPLTLFGSA